MTGVEAGPGRARLLAPGCARDARQQTDVAAEVPFFNDPAMTQRLIERGIEPVVANLPRRCRIADFGGADGFVAAAVRRYLSERGVHADALVADANPRGLALAQDRGLRVVPCDLQHARLAPVHLIAMRLVLHYNTLAGQRRILEAAFRCLAPGGYLVLQAEAGERSNVAYRNLIAKRLGEMEPADGRHAACRWVASASLVELVRKRRFDIEQVDGAFLAFDAPLAELLAMAWTRFHGTPHADARKHGRYLAFCDEASALAKHMMRRNDRSGLHIDANDRVRFLSRHVLIVARKPLGMTQLDPSGAASS